MTAKAPYEGLLTLPVPEGSLASVQEGVRAAIQAQSADGRPLGVEQEFPVYRAAAQGVLGILAGQRIEYAADLSRKLDEAAANTDSAVDIYTVAAHEEHKADFERHAEGVDFPTDDERMVALANAVGVTAHAIAAIELGHVSGTANIDRAQKELGKPGTRADIGSIPDYTLHALLDELRDPAEQSEAA